MQIIFFDRRFKFPGKSRALGQQERPDGFLLKRTLIYTNFGDNAWRLLFFPWLTFSWSFIFNQPFSLLLTILGKKGREAKNARRDFLKRGPPSSSLSGLVLPCLALSCLALPCLVLCLSCLALSRLVLSCVVLSCFVLSCLVLSCLVLSCFVLSCLALCCLAFACLCFILSSLLLLCLYLSCRVLSCLAPHPTAHYPPYTINLKKI